MLDTELLCLSNKPLSHTMNEKFWEEPITCIPSFLLSYNTDLTQIGGGGGGLHSQRGKSSRLRPNKHYAKKIII
jgi:hypothetical protein